MSFIGLSKNIFKKTSYFGCISAETSRTGPLDTECRGTPGRGNILKSITLSTDRYCKVRGFGRPGHGIDFGALSRTISTIFGIFSYDSEIPAPAVPLFEAGLRRTQTSATNCGHGNPHQRKISNSTMCCASRAIKN